MHIPPFSRLFGQGIMEETTSFPITHDIKDAIGYLSALKLATVTLGDYMIIMNAEVDVMIGGEPHVALQLWFNMKSNKFLARIWNQTIAAGTIKHISQFLDTCTNHLKRRPCLGYGVNNFKSQTQDYDICQTPLPRKMSPACQRVLDPNTSASIKSCPECLKMIESAIEGNNAEDFKNEPKTDASQSDIVSEAGRDQISTDIDKDSIFTVSSMKDESIFQDADAKNYDITGDSSPMAAKPEIKKRPLQTKHVIKGRFPESDPLQMTCELCGITTMCTCFAEHMKKVHGEVGKFLQKCPWCEKVISSRSLLHHAYRWHFYGRFSCNRCKFIAYFAIDLINHVNARHDAIDPTKCPSCQELYPLQKLENHHKECLGKRIKVIDRKSKESARVEKVCEICGKTIIGKDHYKTHLKTHLRKKAIEEGDESGIENLFLFCDKCGKRVIGSRVLKLHKETCYDQGKYKCPLCSLVFNTRAQQRKHHNKVHSTDENLECKYCKRRFGNIAYLLQHQRTHEDSKFECKYCQKKMKTQESLIAHERYHTGEKPFKCSMCTNAFVTKERLQQHMAGVHKVVGPKGRKPGWKRKQDKIETSSW